MCQKEGGVAYDCVKRNYCQTLLQKCQTLSEKKKFMEMSLHRAVAFRF